MPSKSPQSGQILVLLTLVMVTLLGFTALTVDGGMIFWTRRRAQNAADSGALAAALAKVRNQDWLNAGYAQAEHYGFENNAMSSVTVVTPPTSGQYLNNPNYVQVIITTTLDTAFAHFVYTGPLQTTVEAVARFQAPGNIFPGNALHATNETACQGVWFAGNGITDIDGGNIFSNSIQDGSSNTSCVAGVASGASAEIYVTGGGINVVGTFREQAGATIVADNGITEGVPHQSLPQIPIPDCTGLPNRTYGGGSATLEPGVYTNGVRVTNSSVNLVLNPGIYCMVDDFYMNGGTVTGSGVMIYLIDGDYSVNGNVTVNLSTSTDLVDASGNQWAGMLIYMDPNNLGQVLLSGNSGSVYTGTIFAPGPTANNQHKCIVEGNGTGLAVNSQVICNTVKITGDALIDINYNAQENYSLAPTLELAQ
jgi:Flp pilus assembly protein TadG